MESQGARRPPAGDTVPTGVSRKVMVRRGMVSCRPHMVNCRVARFEPALETIRHTSRGSGTPLPSCAEPHWCILVLEAELAAIQWQHLACSCGGPLFRISMLLGSLPSACQWQGAHEPPWKVYLDQPAACEHYGLSICVCPVDLYSTQLWCIWELSTQTAASHDGWSLSKALVACEFMG